jgi:hypothetical protein
MLNEMLSSPNGHFKAFVHLRGQTPTKKHVNLTCFLVFLPIFSKNAGFSFTSTEIGNIHTKHLKKGMSVMAYIVGICIGLISFLTYTLFDTFHLGAVSCAVIVGWISFIVFDHFIMKESEKKKPYKTAVITILTFEGFTAYSLAANPFSFDSISAFIFPYVTLLLTTFAYLLLLLLTAYLLSKNIVGWLKNKSHTLTKKGEVKRFT